MQNLITAGRGGRAASRPAALWCAAKSSRSARVKTPSIWPSRSTSTAGDPPVEEREDPLDLLVGVDQAERGVHDLGDA